MTIKLDVYKTYFLWKQLENFGKKCIKAMENLDDWRSYILMAYTTNLTNKSWYVVWVESNLRGNQLLSTCEGSLVYWEGIHNERVDCSSSLRSQIHNWEKGSKVPNSEETIAIVEKGSLIVKVPKKLSPKKKNYVNRIEKRKKFRIWMSS